MGLALFVVVVVGQLSLASSGELATSAPEYHEIKPSLFTCFVAGMSRHYSNLAGALTGATAAELDELDDRRASWLAQDQEWQAERNRRLQRLEPLRQTATKEWERELASVQLEVLRARVGAAAQAFIEISASLETQARKQLIDEVVACRGVGSVGSTGSNTAEVLAAYEGFERRVHDLLAESSK